MTDSLDYTLRLSGFLIPEETGFSVCCPSLNVWTQGETEEEAKKNLDEAVSLWLETCIESEILVEALTSLGWAKGVLPPGSDSIEVARREAQRPAPAPQYRQFSIACTVPAYQAAAFLNANGEACAIR